VTSIVTYNEIFFGQSGVVFCYFQQYYMNMYIFILKFYEIILYGEKCSSSIKLFCEICDACLTGFNIYIAFNQWKLLEFPKYL